MNFAICDDTIKEIALIKHILEEHFKGCIIDEFYNGTSLLKHLEGNVPDIVLLDVEMPGINGLETARKIRDCYPQLGLIFITGHSKYALEAFGVYAYDFIVKPVNRERLVSSVSRLIGRMADYESFIEIQNRGTIFRVNQNDIIFVEKNFNRCYVYTSKFVYSMRTTLKYFYEKLDTDIFIKTHSGFIVNKSKISSITPKGNLAYEIHFEATDKKALISRGMRYQVNLDYGRKNL